MSLFSNYNRAMPRFVHNLWISLLAAILLLAGCARDVNTDLDEEPYPDEVKIGYRMRGPLSTDVWYYMVFNYTAAPSTGVAQNPIDFISDEDRGINWERYIVYHRDPNLGEQLLTLQRPRVPTIVATSTKPVDVTAGQFTDDEVLDLIVACEDGDIVEIIQGIEPDPFDPVFYETAEEFDSGPSPIRLRVGDFTGDSVEDLSIVYAGTDGEDAFIRVLAGGGEAPFTLATDTTVPGTPVEAVIGDYNLDGEGDWALLSRDPDTDGMTVYILLGDGIGGFIQDESVNVDNTAVDLARWNIDGEDGVELVIGVEGAAGGEGSVVIYAGTLNDDATVSYAEASEIAIEGNVRSVDASNVIAATSGILAGYVTAEGEGRASVLLHEGAFEFTQELLVPTPGPAQYVLAHDANGDSTLDIMVLDGRPAENAGSTLYIFPGGSQTDIDTGDRNFVWDDQTIDYLTGTAPTLIRPQDLDGDGVEDLLIPNSGSDDNGNSVCIFYGLGDYNYASADIYWTDEVPEPLTGQEWYVSHTIGPNFIEITLDPGVFYDLARQPPDQDDGFNVIFMTGTTGIDLESNQDQLGEVRDYLDRAINIPMDVGYFDDEQNTPLANTNVEPVPSEDIDDWRVEVF